MIFNIMAMKQRTKNIMRKMNPSPFLTTFVMVLLTITLYVGLYFGIVRFEQNVALWLIVIMADCIIMGMFHTSYCWYSLSAAREENPGWREVFGAFTYLQWKALLGIVLKTIIITFLGLMCFIPGVIAYYWFRPLEYIIKDNPEQSVFSSVYKCVRMMKGHNLELLKLDFSYVGWYFIFLFFWPIGVYVAPYAGITYAEFYDYIRGQEELFGES